MKLRILSKTETEIYGATHMAQITYLDLAAAPAALTYNLNVLPGTISGVLPAPGTTGTDNLPTYFKTELVGYILDQQFAGGAIATATVTIGDTASAGRYAAAFTVFTDNTATTGTGIIANQPYVNVAATALKCLFTTTTGNVNVATQGSIRLFFKCVDMTQLPLS